MCVCVCAYIWIYIDRAGVQCDPLPREPPLFTTETDLYYYIYCKIKGVKCGLLPGEPQQASAMYY